MDDRLRASRDYWDRFARWDPLWAVLSEPGRENRRWELQAFMDTGEREISLLLQRLRRLGADPGRGRACDFGCGVGRLSQALARRFAAVLGMDISPAMIEHATLLNEFPDTVAYDTAADPNLPAIASESCDLVYSNIVLQHVEPELTRAYLRTFLRILRPDGTLVFQLPSHRAPAALGGPLPMPDEAYSASVAFAGAVPSVLVPGETAMIPVRVTNTSPVDWDQQTCGALRVGNHWLTRDGDMLLQDDGRTPLPGILPAGGECLVELAVRAPEEGGPLVLQIDVVHEGFTWFADRGGRHAAAVIDFAGSAGTAATPPPANPRPVFTADRLSDALPDADTVGAPGPFPMHAIARDEVLALLEAAGGQAVGVEEDGRARPEWVAYEYVVRRRRQA